MEMKLGFMIQKLCNEQGLTIAELSRRSGVPKQTIHNWTTGQLSINPIQAIKVAVVLKTNLTNLVLGNANEPKKNT